MKKQCITCLYNSANGCLRGIKKGYADKPVSKQGRHDYCYVPIQTESEE